VLFVADSEAEKSENVAPQKLPVGNQEGSI